MYLFIYLFGSLPAPSFHGCRHIFFPSFLLWLGDLLGRAVTLALFLGWWDSGRTATAAPWLLWGGVGGPACLPTCGYGFRGGWARGVADCVYRIDIWKPVLDGVPSGSSLGLCFEQHVACWFYLSEILYRGIKDLIFFFLYLAFFE